MDLNDSNSFGMITHGGDVDWDCDIMVEDGNDFYENFDDDHFNFVQGRQLYCARKTQCAEDSHSRGSNSKMIHCMR